MTVEKLAQVLEDNPRGTLLLRDELAAWFGSFTRYKGKQGGSDVPNWLEMHRAGCLIVDRKTGDRPSIFVPRAATCVTGGIQPGTLARCLTVENLDAGLGARILPPWPPRQPKVWKEDEIHPEVSQAYESLLRALADLTFGENDRKEREPFALRMTPEAKAVWVEYYNEWAKRQAAVEGATAAAYAKLEGGAARLALLHSVITRVGVLADDCDPIEADSMRAGITLARWFAFEAAAHLCRVGRVGGRWAGPPPYRLHPPARRTDGRPHPPQVQQGAIPDGRGRRSSLTNAGRIWSWRVGRRAPRPQGRPADAKAGPQEPGPAARRRHGRRRRLLTPYPETSKPRNLPTALAAGTAQTEVVLPRNTQRKPPKPPRTMKIPLFPRVSGFRGFGV